MIMNINRNVTVNRCALNILIWYNLNWNVHANVKMEEQIE
jgi:hypothetical protein